MQSAPFFELLQEVMKGLLVLHKAKEEDFDEVWQKLSWNSLMQGLTSNTEYIDNRSRKAEARSWEELHNLAIQKTNTC